MDYPNDYNFIFNLAVYRVLIIKNTTIPSKPMIFKIYIT